MSVISSNHNKNRVISFPKRIECYILLRMRNPKTSVLTTSKHQPKYADIILKESPSSYGPFEIAFKIPCLTESNRFLSEIISSGITILSSNRSNRSLVLTNDKLVKIILNMSL